MRNDEPLVYVCDCYQKFNVVTGMPKKHIRDLWLCNAERDFDYMQDFYAGKVSREDLDSYFEKCCTSMRTTGPDSIRHPEPMGQIIHRS